MVLDDTARERLEGLHTAIVCDVTDELGIRDNVLDLRIRPIWGRETVVGSAFTMQRIPMAYQAESFQEHAKVTHAALRSITPGDMVVMAVPSDIRAGGWGELLSTAAIAGGAVGAVTDGYTRDAPQMEDHGFPVWARGHSPIDAQGRCRVNEFDVPVEVGGVKIDPGDIVMADYQGVIRIPPDVLSEVIEEGERRFDAEDDIRENLRSGRSREEVLEELDFM